MSGKSLSVLVAVISIVVGAGRAEAESRVVEVTIAAGGPSVFELIQDDQPVTAVSGSVIIQGALLPALLGGSKDVKVEPVQGSNAIQRVEPYTTVKTMDPLTFEGKCFVSRIATQRKANGTDEHLEVFLKVAPDEEKAFNVYDPLLQQAIFSVHSAQSMSGKPISLEVAFDDPDNPTEIASITVKAKSDRDPAKAGKPSTK